MSDYPLLSVGSHLNSSYNDCTWNQSQNRERVKFRFQSAKWCIIKHFKVVGYILVTIWAQKWYQTPQIVSENTRLPPRFQYERSDVIFGLRKLIGAQLCVLKALNKVPRIQNAKELNQFRIKSHMKVIILKQSLKFSLTNWCQNSLLHDRGQPNSKIDQVTSSNILHLKLVIQRVHFLSTFIFLDFSLTSEKFLWRLDMTFW